MNEFMNRIKKDIENGEITINQGRNHFGLEQIRGGDVICIKKQPLGLKPKWIHDQQRLEEIESAMERYINCNKQIPFEWLNEYNNLVSEGGD